MAFNYTNHLDRRAEVCGGALVVKGARGTVRTLLANLAEGASEAEILADFPTLTKEGLRAVVAFAVAETGDDLPVPFMPSIAACIAEAVGGLVLIAAGFYYFKRARAFCERVRSHARQTNRRWHPLFNPQWFWGTEQCVFQCQATAIGLIFGGVLLLVIAGLNIFDSHHQ